MRTYTPGNQIVLSGTFIDATTLQPVEPTGVTLQVRDPNGVITAYVFGTAVNMTNPTTGVFQALLVPYEAGTWTYRWQGSGNVIAASETQFEVRASYFVELTYSLAGATGVFQVLGNSITD